MDKIVLPKVLIYTSGLPGAGKTQFSSKLAKASNAGHVFVDLIAFNLYGALGFFKNSDHEIVLKEAQYKMDDLLSDNRAVVYDANVNTTEWRDKLEKYAAQKGVQSVCVYINTPIDISRHRALIPRYGPRTKAWRVLKPHQFEGKLSKFSEPKGNNVIKISGTLSFQDQLKILSDYLESHKS
jgi:predicted kinase